MLIVLESLLLFVLGCKFIELKLYKQKKLEKGPGIVQ